MTTTEQGARCATLRATEPSIRPLKPPRPRDPTTTRSASSIASSRAWPGLPRWVAPVSVTPSGTSAADSHSFRAASASRSNTAGFGSAIIRSPPSSMGSSQQYTARTVAPRRPASASAQLIARCAGSDPSIPTRISDLSASSAVAVTGPSAGGTTMTGPDAWRTHFEATDPNTAWRTRAPSLRPTTNRSASSAAAISRLAGAPWVTSTSADRSR